MSQENDDSLRLSLRDFESSCGIPESDYISSYFETQPIVENSINDRTRPTSSTQAPRSTLSSSQIPSFESGGLTPFVSSPALSSSSTNRPRRVTAGKSIPKPQFAMKGPRTSQPQSSSSGVASSSRDAGRKKRNTKKWLHEMKKYQKSTAHMIPRAPFTRLVREVASEVPGGERVNWKPAALEMLREAAENNIVELLRASYWCSLHAKRVTLMPKDIHLVKKVSPVFDGRLDRIARSSTRSSR